MRCYYITSWIAKKKRKKLKAPSLGEDMEWKESETLIVGTQNGPGFLENHMELLNVANLHLCLNRPLLCIFLKKWKLNLAQNKPESECLRSFICNSPKLEANQISFSEEWIKLCDPCNGILYCNKVEQMIHVTTWINFSGHNAEWRKANLEVNLTCVWFHLYKILKKDKVIYVYICVCHSHPLLIFILHLKYSFVILR